jgi:hypothetical protein
MTASSPVDFDWTIGHATMHVQSGSRIAIIALEAPFTDEMTLIADCHDAAQKALDTLAVRRGRFLGLRQPHLDRYLWWRASDGTVVLQIDTSHAPPLPVGGRMGRNPC